MKKYYYSVLVMALFAIGFAASDDSESESVAEETPTEFMQASVETMLSDLKQNEMRAQKKYGGKYMEVTGTLGSMDSEGEYFSLEDNSFGILDVHCKIPKNKREEITNKLIQMEKGDLIVVKGKITDMGEIMGYHLTVIDVSNK